MTVVFVIAVALCGLAAEWLTCKTQIRRYDGKTRYKLNGKGWATLVAMVGFTAAACISANLEQEAARAETITLQGTIKRRFEIDSWLAKAMENADTYSGVTSSTRDQLLSRVRGEDDRNANDWLRIEAAVWDAFTNVRSNLLGLGIVVAEDLELLAVRQSWRGPLETMESTQVVPTHTVAPTLLALFERTRRRTHAAIQEEFSRKLLGIDSLTFGQTVPPPK
ncbi:MAG: hypothetical protein AABX23_03935 [Nanoarchaeota archaeon]